ncbi:MAG: MFS transporter [Burkholderiaceae bacterium]|nr:MFS transporter [Burkholderiaceae bacterium]
MPLAPSSRFRSQVALLAVLQALLLTNNVTLIAVNGLAGLQLAPTPLLATFPVTGYVLGGAVWAMPAALFMRRYGRRAGYTLGSLVAMLGSLLAWHAMNAGSLWLLCLATFVCGLYNAFGASLRFAAADVVDAAPAASAASAAQGAWRERWRPRAISLVLAGGIAGGVVGPEISKWSRGALATPFAGSYLVLVAFAALSLLLVQALRVPVPSKSAASGSARPMREILRDPVCRVAILCAALAYGVMNLLMVATPLAMEVCGLPYEAAAFVIEWHVIGMFAPGLFSGALIGRFGALPVVFAGAVLMLGCVGVALSGVELMHFTIALFALGVGWNFMYTGATALLTQSYRPAEKNKVQGFMDSIVFATMITSSASSGALLFVDGWSVLNLLSLPFVVVVLAAVLWLAARSGWAFGRPGVGAAS